MRKYSKTVFIIGIVCFCLANTIFAAPVITESWIGKTVWYNQWGDKEPILDLTHPYGLSSGCSIQGGNLIKATLKTPSNITNNYSLYSFSKGNIYKSYQTLTALNKYFPAGNYTLDISATTGNQSVTIRNNLAAFPAKPRIMAGNNTVWIDENLYVKNNNLPCSFSWQLPQSKFDEVFIAIDNVTVIKTLSNSTSTFTIEKADLDKLPNNEPIGCLVQFNSFLGNSATIFHLIKVDLGYDGIFKIVKNNALIQSDNTNPKEWGTQGSTEFFSDYGPYSFTMEATRRGFVIDPKGNRISLDFKYPNQSIFNSGPISSKDELNRLFPDGNYKLGNQTATLSGSIYPNNGLPIKILYVNGKTPTWINGKLELNPKAKNLIQWTPFNITSKDFPSKGAIEFDIKYKNPFIHNLKEVKSGLTHDDTSAFNSFTIDANTLNSDRDYFMSIKYFLASSVNAATQSGGGYSTSTYIWISPTGK